jgi:hypothetical protein
MVAWQCNIRKSIVYYCSAYDTKLGKIHGIEVARAGFFLGRTKVRSCFLISIFDGHQKDGS